jgi:RNA polymerase sigma-70 factor (ECF subfamily)
VLLLGELVKPDAERLFRHRLSEMLPRLSRFALGLTRSRAEADDLIQSACERALSRVEQWDPGTRLDSWMFRIMQTIWFNELRSRRVRQKHSEEQRDQPEAVENGEQLAEMRVLLGRVEQEIFQLPEEQRVVLMLVCIEGMTYTEAAEAASIPVGTVMSRLARARLGLMQRLAENDSLPRDNVIRLVSKWHD